MTEKERFRHFETYLEDGQLVCYGIDDTKENFVYNFVDKTSIAISVEKLIDLLNKQNVMFDAQKKQLQTLSNIVAEQDRLLDKLNEENKQLKQQLKDNTR